MICYSLAKRADSNNWLRTFTNIAMFWDIKTTIWVLPWVYVTVYSSNILLSLATYHMATSCCYVDKTTSIQNYPWSWYINLWLFFLFVLAAKWEAWLMTEKKSKRERSGRRRFYHLWLGLGDKEGAWKRWQWQQQDDDEGATNADNLSRRRSKNWANHLPLFHLITKLPLKTENKSKNNLKAIFFFLSYTYTVFKN